MHDYPASNRSDICLSLSSVAELGASAQILVDGASEVSLPLRAGITNLDGTVKSRVISLLAADASGAACASKVGQNSITQSNLIVYDRVADGDLVAQGTFWDATGGYAVCHSKVLSRQGDREELVAMFYSLHDHSGDRDLSSNSDLKAGRDKEMAQIPEFVLRAALYINAHIEGALSLETISGTFGVSSHHFSRVFKSAFGLSPHQYILDCRQDWAELFLRYTDLSLPDIARRCGFSSQSHMTTVFRNRMNTTPAVFRQRS